MPQTRFQVDIAPVEQIIAADLVVHHLALAMGYFQALPEGEEREKLQAHIDERFQGFGLEKKVAGKFADALCEAYNELKEYD